MKNYKKIQRIKHIEKHLRNYPTYEAGIKAMEIQLDYIMPNMSASYDVAGGGSAFHISSSTENCAIDRIESKRALEIHETMEKYAVIINSIDEAMKELDDTERLFLRLRYFKGYKMPKTALEMNYSEKHLFNIRNQIFDKLLISLQGLLYF